MNYTPFSWIPASLKWSREAAWWVLFPLRIISMVADFLCNAVFLATILFFAALFMGYIPKANIDAALNKAGNTISGYVVPHVTGTIKTTQEVKVN